MDYSDIRREYLERERDTGFLLLRGFFNKENDARPRLLALASSLGDPQYETGGRAVWDIRPTSRTGTFSETNEKVPGHTDAAYEDQPARHLVMGCQSPAIDGGVTRVIPTKPIIDDLTSRIELRSWVERLFNREWSWRRPAIFMRKGLPEVSKPKPILLADGGVQWRFDNLVYRDESQMLVARFFELTVEHEHRGQLIEMQPGDAIILSNRHALHGRSAFSDPRRHYLRVRVH